MHSDTWRLATTTAKTAFLVTVLFGIAGCADEEPAEPCVEGATEACACPGVDEDRTCTDGAWSVCECAASGEDAGLTDGDVPCVPTLVCSNDSVFSEGCGERTHVEYCAHDEACFEGACRTPTARVCVEDRVWFEVDGSRVKIAEECFPRGRCEERIPGEAECSSECDDDYFCDENRAVTRCGEELWVYEDCNERESYRCYPNGPPFGEQPPHSYCAHKRELTCGGDVYYYGVLVEYCEPTTERCVESPLGGASCECRQNTIGSTCDDNAVRHFTCREWEAHREQCGEYGCASEYDSMRYTTYAWCCSEYDRWCDEDVLRGCADGQLGAAIETCEFGCVAEEPAGAHCCDPETEDC